MTLQLAKGFRSTRVFGIDIDTHAIQLAEENAQRESLSNCTFSVADICDLGPEWENKFDYIFTFDVLHDLRCVKTGLMNVKLALKEGGYLSAIETKMNSELQDNVGKSWAPFIYGVGLFHCVPTCLHEGAGRGREGGGREGGGREGGGREGGGREGQGREGGGRERQERDKDGWEGDGREGDGREGDGREAGGREGGGREAGGREGALGPGWGWETAIGFLTESGFKDVKIVQKLDLKLHILAKK